MGRAPEGVRSHRLRFYRRNFRRMYPEAGAQAKAELEQHLRRRAWLRYVTAAAALVAAAGVWWALVLR